MNNPICVYHHPCSDGFTAAWLFSKAYPDAEFVPAKYGDEPPYIIGRDVVVVDFSYPRDVMIHMAEEAKSLVVLDHHKSAMEACHGLPFCHFDMDKCGSELMLDYMIKTNIGKVYWAGATGFVAYIRDRDLWEWKLPYSKEINTAIRSYEMTFENWDKLVGTGTPILASEGTAIKRYRRQLIEMHKRWATFHPINGLPIPVVYCTVPEVVSEVAGELCEENNSPFAVCYRREASGYWRYELRSRGDFDVSDIAKKYGGGGHKNAAGFRLVHKGFGWE